MAQTKNRILEVAEQLFYEQGIAGTRLQQVADAAGISVGNLAYHFKNKEAMVEAIYENLFEEMSAILSQYIASPQLAGFDKQFAALYQFYDHNKFAFNNSWEIARNFPDIQQGWLSMNNKILLQLKKRMEYNTQHGFFKPEPYKGAYEMLCQSLLLTINCWFPQQALRNKPAKEEQYKRALWNMLYPNFTEKGKKEFHLEIEPIIF